MGGVFLLLLYFLVIYLARKKGLHTFAPLFLRNKERNAIPWLKIIEFHQQKTKLHYILLFIITRTRAQEGFPPFQPSKNCTRSHRGNQRKNKTKIHENASKTYSRMGSICV